MRTALLRGLIATVAGITASTVGLTTTTTGVSAAPRHVLAAAASTLPSHQAWLADVAAVTNQAKAYLAQRLPDRDIRAAVVLDVDNTALQSHYGFYTATPSVLALAEQARTAGAAVFFVTARPEIIEGLTKLNLGAVGYHWADVYTRPYLDFSDNQTLKTNARIAIEQRGYTVVANVGNSATDLGGGHAERTFKLPDYSGQLD